MKFLFPAILSLALLAIPAHAEKDFTEEIPALLSQIKAVANELQITLEDLSANPHMTCPWHGAEFNITNGEVLGEPAPEGVKSYKIHIEGEEIKIES